MPLVEMRCHDALIPSPSVREMGNVPGFSPHYQAPVYVMSPGCRVDG